MIVKKEALIVVLLTFLIFRLSLTFTEDYPQKPPTVTFVDK